jgi:hypothetical protein
MLFNKKGKYGNKKIEVDGVKFDSKLEMFCYNLFKNNELDFDFQKTITLIDKFKYNGESIRAITIIVDFVLNVNDIVYYIDSKGFPTEVSKIKYKMLKNQLKEDKDTDVLWLKSQKQAIEFVNNLKKKKDEHSKQSDITW